jgi:tetratricopeptide (TPR) repeat protein/predicted Ser/Thr protein kinase
MIGTTVSHYRILEKIGEGGMGEVYLAEDTKLRRQVSLKFLSEDLTRDEARKQRFIQEARAAAAIEHPHIAAIHDIDEADGRTFIAMEYVRGKNLREHIESGKLNLRRSLELGFQIADGLAKAHERGVVHRDVKPENVLVSEDGYAKIIDFGLAKLLEPLMPSTEDESKAEAETEIRLKTREGLVMGTVSYMSPEQARGEAVDARSDVFSFGAVLYEMVSGQSPFRKGSLAESMSAVLHQTPSALAVPTEAIPPELQRALRKALAKEPSDRYQSMKDLAIDLRNLREETSSAARPAVVPTAGAKLLWPWVAVVAVGLAGAVIGWLLLGRDRGPPGIGASGRPAIAVMYFESLSGDEEIRWLSKGLPSMLITDLAQTPGLDVVSSQRINEILKVVVGSIFKAGDGVRIDVQVEDVGTGRVLSAESVRGADVFPLVDDLTRRIRTSLQLADRPAGRPIAEVTTLSLEAYQLYSEGLEARKNLRFVDAREFLEEAVKVDPSFAMAYFELSFVVGRLGETGLSKQYRDTVLEHLDRLPDRQNLLIQAEYLRLEGELERSVDLYETLIARYPDEENAHLGLARAYSGLNQPEKSLAAVERGVQALPHASQLRNDYGYRLLHAGRYPEAIRELETNVRLYPDEPNPYDSLAEAFLITGQPDKALEKYAHALEVDPTFGHEGRVWAFAMLGRYDEALAERAEITKALGGPTTLTFMDAFILSRVGRYREAEKRLQSGIEVSVSLENVGMQGAHELLSAVLSIDKENYPATLESVSRVQRLATGVFPRTAYLLAGTAEARAGDLEAAHAHLDSQRELYDSGSPGRLYHTLAGEIALAAGDLAAAEAHFSDAEPEVKAIFSISIVAANLFRNNLPFRGGLARVKKAQGDLAGAIEIYRNLNTPDISNKWTAMLEPRYVLEVARLLDETGDKEAAREEYQRFLDLWKDADPELPELDEARRYLGQ